MPSKETTKTPSERGKTPAKRSARKSAKGTKAKRSAKKSAAPTSAKKSGKAKENESDAAGRREEIRHAAFICFAAHGYHETRLEDICREAGVSRGAFYWHFESKEAIFLEILEVWTLEVQEQVRIQFAGALDTGAQPGFDPAKVLLEALQREGRRGRRVIPLWIDGLVQSRNHPKMRAAMAQFLAGVRGTMAEVIRPVFAPYHEPHEVELLASLLFSCFIGAISQEIVDPEGAGYDEQVAQLLTTSHRFARLVVQSGETQRGASQVKEVKPS